METLLYLLCTSLPSHIIVFYQYWDFPWRSKGLAAVLACVNMALKLWVASRLMEMGMGLRLMEVCFSLLGALIYVFFIKVDRFKLLFTYMLMLDYLIIIRGVASFLAIRLFSAGAQSWQSSLICFLLYFLTMPVILPPFRRAARQADQANAPALWHTIWLIPALITTVVLLYTDVFQEEVAGSWPFLLARLSLLVCVIAVSLLLRALDGFRRQAALEEQARQSAYILSLQRSQYANLQSYMEEIRRAIAIVADNSAPEPPRTDSEGGLLSTKHDGPGIGTRSIRYIAGQYHGTADFRWEDGMFCASVFLNPSS